ncbi:aldehyde dehydrogenase [Xylariaceae sp. FL0255]|nr:aldehyde dehydrogenase [Xylariaceae sp. FL0255]
MAVNIDATLHIPVPHDVSRAAQFTSLKGAADFAESPTKPTSLEGMIPLTFTSFQNVINGQLSSSEVTRSTINPSTLETNPDVPVSTMNDVNRAVAVAQAASGSWAEVPWSERKRAVEAFADALEAHVNEFGHILVREMGLTLAAAVYDVRWGVEWLRDFCKLSLEDRVIDVTCERHIVERYTPIGVTVGIVPWNGPVVLTCGKIAPAMLTGNTLILKPSPFAPYSILKMVELAQQFFPSGVLQALSGDDSLGPWLTEHPGVGKVSFTGSIATGRLVMASCSQNLKRVSLELGGNDPTIVCADVDPTTIAPKIAQTATLRAGQLCMAIKRIYVHESVYDAVRAGIIKCFERMKVGDGFDESVTMGPLSNGPQYERARELLEDLKKSGLEISPAENIIIQDQGGFFIRPILVSNPPGDAKIVVEEPFAPIVPIMKWSSEADVIHRANNTHFGLGASVWSRDLGQAQRIARKLEAGNIWINTHAELQANTAFACHKQSGFGSELGIDGLKSWCNVQATYTRALL